MNLFYVARYVIAGDTKEFPMTNAFLNMLDTRDWILADGATGTNLFNMGLSSGDALSCGTKPTLTTSANYTKWRWMRAVICF